MRAVFPQRLKREGSDDHAAPTLLRLRFGLDKSLVRRSREDAPYLQRASREVDVLPLESQQLAAPHAGGERQDEERFQAMPTSRRQQFIRLLDIERLDLEALPVRRRYQVAHVARNQPPLDRRVERLVQYTMKHLDGGRRKPVLHLLGVERLHMLSG